MNSKDIDFQLASVMRLRGTAMPVTRDAKLAFQRSASTATSFLSYLVTQRMARKVVGVDQVVEAVGDLAVPGLGEAVARFIQLEAERARSRAEAGAENREETGEPEEQVNEV